MLKLKTIAVVLLIAASASAAQYPVKAEVEPLFGNMRSGDGWVPMLVTLRNNTNQVLDLDIRISSRNVPCYATRTGVKLPSDGKSHKYILYQYLSQNTWGGQLEVLYEGRPLKLDGNAARFQWPRTTSIHVVGISRDANALGALRNMNPPDRSPFRDRRGNNNRVSVCHIDRGNDLTPLPDHFMGYDCSNIVVINGGDISTLNLAESQALLNWVHKGGEIVLSPGMDANWFDDELVKQFVKIDKVKTDLSCTGLVRNQSVAFHTMDIPGARWCKSGTFKIAARTACGLGGVTVLAVDLSEPAIKSWQGNRDMWQRVITQMRRNPRRGVLPGGENQFGGTSRQNRDFTKFLSVAKYPGLALIGALICFYIIVAGPINFMVLRRKRRLVLLPVSMALIAMTYIGITFVTGYIDKGVSSTLRKVSLIELVPGTDRGYERTFFSIFSSAPRAYNISLPCRSATVSFFTDWSGYRSTPLTCDYSGKAVLADHNITMWSTGFFASEGFVDGIGSIDYDPRRMRVTNKTKFHLRDASVRMKRKVYRLGDIAPGASIDLPKPNVPGDPRAASAGTPFQRTAWSKMAALARASNSGPYLLARIDEDPAPPDVGTDWVRVSDEAVYVTVPLGEGVGQ